MQLSIYLFCCFKFLISILLALTSHASQRVYSEHLLSLTLQMFSRRFCVSFFFLQKALTSGATPQTLGAEACSAPPHPLAGREGGGGGGGGGGHRTLPGTMGVVALSLAVPNFLPFGRLDTIINYKR